MKVHNMKRMGRGCSSRDNMRGRLPIWFSPDVAGYIGEKIWHESQEIHQQKDGSIIFEAEVAGTDEIKFWIMSWGSKALVLEPASLRDELMAEAEAIQEKYGKTNKELDGTLRA